LRALLDGNGLSIFALTETWLKGFHSKKSVAIPGYNFFHNFRPRRRGGGVGFYIASHIKCHLIWKSDKSVPFKLEYILLKISHNNQDILLCNFYRPDDVPLNDALEVIADLLQQWEIFPGQKSVTFDPIVRFG
jgi:hypothetical protein